MKVRFLFPLILCFATPAFSQQDATPTPPPTRQQVSAKTYFIRIIPPRTTFLEDMTEAEGKLMKQHLAYWSDQFAKGVCIFGGPVLDPKGGYGVAVIKAANRADATAIAAADPSVKAGLNRIELAEMQVTFFAKNQ